MYEGNLASAESMYDVGPSGLSHLAEAKAAAEARGEYIFAEPDHVGIQARCVPGTNVPQGHKLRLVSRAQLLLNASHRRAEPAAHHNRVLLRRFLNAVI